LAKNKKEMVLAPSLFCLGLIPSFNFLRSICICFFFWRWRADPPLPLSFRPSLRGDSHRFNLWLIVVFTHVIKFFGDNLTISKLGISNY
jgi:hypothetical protein